MRYFGFSRGDQHCHTTISSDGISTMEEMIKEAIKKGFKFITFTEHFDSYMYVKQTKATCSDLKKYAAEAERCRKKYPMIRIHFGIEVGMRPEPEVVDVMLNELKYYEFDFVIGSIHITDGIDIAYDNSFFDGRTRDEAYGRYLDVMLKCIELWHDHIDVLGHMDYVTRYGEGYKGGKFDSFTLISKCNDVLRALVKYGIGLEINTSGYVKGFNRTNPDFEIIKRFHDMGGKIITIGSDAHVMTNLGSHFADAIELAQKAGFKNVAVFKNREPEFYAL